MSRHEPEDNSHIAQPILETWFPYTKLRPPQFGDGMLIRSQLQARMRQAVHRHKLTLVAAPAGSSKTMLCSALAHDDIPAVWITLDSSDDDLPIFAALLVTALSKRLRDRGQAIVNFLLSVPNLHEKIAQLATLFINSFAPHQHEPVLALILDDYHVLQDPAIHQFMAQWLEYLPSSVRLVIATRYDPPLPLPRLRARGELAEVRLPELRLDAREASRYLNEIQMLGLSEAEVMALQQSVEGWISGLKLVAAVLQTLAEGNQRSAYIQRLNSTSRAIFEFLAEEVFTVQPPEVQEFLLQTSVLPELTPAICLHVTENPDAASLLASIYRRNLFLTALTPDASDGPFVYHALFAGFLQQRLQESSPELWREVHNRAAQAATNDEQRLIHCLQAACWKEAAALLEKMGQIDATRRLMRRRVVHSIQDLPSDIQEAHPWLLLFVGQYYALRGQVEAATPWLSRAAARFLAEGDELGQVEILATQAMTDALESEQVVLAFRAKVATVGHLLRPDHWAVYHGAEQWYAIATHDWDTVTTHLRASIQRALPHSDPGPLTMTNLTIGPQQLFVDGGMLLLERFAAHSLQHAKADEWILQICAWALMGNIRFFQGNVVEAEHAASTAHALLQQIGGLSWIDDHIAWLLLTLALSRRDYQAFDHLFAGELVRRAGQETAMGYRKGFMYLQGRALWLRQDIDAARAILVQMEQDTVPSGYEGDDIERVLLLSGLLSISSGDLAKAEELLSQAVMRHRDTRHTVLLTHPRLALATLYAKQKRWVQAMSELRSVIAEINRWQAPGIILQEGESITPILVYAIEQGIEPLLLQPLLEILQPAPSAKPILLPHTGEHLTVREVEVLRLLATGATNRAIAESLTITERTVKAHVTRILAKLGVTTRAGAVSRANQLYLL